MTSARELAARLDKINSPTPVLTRSETKGLGAGEWRAVHWVKPLLICEVAFTEWTSDGRIRHPSFQGLREDKDASEVKQERPMPIPVPAASRGANANALVAAGITISHPDRGNFRNRPHYQGRTGGAMARRCRTFPDAAHPRATRSACCVVRKASMESSAFFSAAREGASARTCILSTSSTRASITNTSTSRTKRDCWKSFRWGPSSSTLGALRWMRSITRTV